MASAERPDRVDFLTFNGNRTIVQKFERDDAGTFRDRLLSSEEKPADFDLEAALAWCEGHGYVVRRWWNGARAWKAEKPWVIRTRGQIKTLRIRLEKEALEHVRRGGEPRSTLCMDLAYDG